MHFIGFRIWSYVFPGYEFITNFVLFVSIYDVFDNSPGFCQIILVLNNLRLVELLFSNSQQSSDLIAIIFIYCFIMSNWMSLWNLKKLVFMLNRFFKTCSEPRESIPAVPFLDSSDWKYMVIYISRFFNEVLIVSFTLLIHIQSIPFNIQYTLFTSVHLRFIYNS